MRDIKLSDKAYKILKWTCLLALPTVTFITSVSNTLGYEHGSKIAAIVSALGAFAGAVIKLSNDNYYSDQD